MLWYENLDFMEDPYVIHDPMTIPPNFIRWNRDDLSGKDEINDFLERVVSKQRIGMKIYGTSGSGKTWLLRHIMKLIKEKLKNEALIIYVSIPGIEPTFAAFYERFIENIIPHLEPILKAINENAGDSRNNWTKYIGERDLSDILWNIQHKENIELSKAWLLGRKLTTAELRNIKVLSSLDKDYRKHGVFRTLIQNSLLAFSTYTLMIDEIGYFPARVARAFGESLREMLDSFYDRFSLICTYTAETADVMIDYGYSQFLFTRLEREVKMDTIKKEFLPTFLQIYQTAYRKEDFEVENQLFPFEQSGLEKLIELMNPERHYPRFILTNCGILAKKAAITKQKIDNIFVNKNIDALKDLASTSYLHKQVSQHHLPL